MMLAPAGRSRSPSPSRMPGLCAGHVTGVSVVCGEPAPELTPVRETPTGALVEGEVVWQGSDGALDQVLAPV